MTSFQALTDDTARSIGMSSYFPHVKRVFVEILRALDVQYGRPLMMTSTQNVNKVTDSVAVLHNVFPKIANSSESSPAFSLSVGCLLCRRNQTKC